MMLWQATILSDACGFTGDDNEMRDNVHGRTCHRSFSYSYFDDEEEELEDEEQLKAPAEEECSHKSKDVSRVSPLPRTTQVVFEIQSGRAVPRLREPRHLYGVSGHVSQTLPRWPHKWEVIPGEIEHIEWAPPFPEPLCAQMNTNEWLRPESEEEGTVVYDTQRDGREDYSIDSTAPVKLNQAHLERNKCYLHPDKDNYFLGSRVGGRRSSLTAAAVSLSGPDDITLLFEGRFESGNLLKATRVGEFDYELSLRTDLYTEKHTQWFYFRVRNTRAGVLYRFTITNLLKVTSLYEEGQLPLLYSEEEARVQGVGWHRVGQQVSYQRNGRQHANQPCYSLSWTFCFPYDQDTCYLAHCYPYTYSNLWAHLSEIERDPRRSRFCKVRTLCRSLAGNLVPVLTVTNPSHREDRSHKPAVVLTARIHPGETNSSWVMKGVLNFLLGDSPDAALLRDAFVFKLVPMLNPDGVIVGNYRCSLAGRDLNRSYKSILRESFPTVWATHTMVQRLCEERKVLLYCDLHGHSRKHNVFTYGCEKPRSADRHPHERVFSLMLSKNCPDMFSFGSCKFKAQRSKEGTGRVSLWRLGVLNSFTLETSFCGSNIGKRKGTHFSTQDLEMLGAQFCDTLLDYCDPDRTKYSTCLRELQEIMRQEAGLPIDNEPTDTLLTDHEASASGSNSSQTDGPPAHLQAFNKMVSRKKLKSKKERNRSHLVRVREEKGENGVKGTLEKSKYVLKPLKAPPVVPRREPPKWRERQLVPPEPSPPDKKVSVLYFVFDTKRPAMTSKSEYLQHLMADYVRSRMQFTLNGYDWGPGQCPQATRPPPHHVPSFLRPTLPPSQLPRDNRDGERLPGLANLPAGDKSIRRLSPVQWRGPKSYTAPSSLQLPSNSQEKCSTAQGHQCKCHLWHC
ncbi:cytosolic carboxypeptidase 2 isoform X2 [Coregonus clupeaformis]|uniref:cytosolic carboxypeptidase 2 isoform X2 n=1 Tax=Coregonus clupeaformis TaxID=59861 RepID=UPI001E1C6B09|nr:cytosolic carboxypeptidase 2 isoform X2 [Coregonus clupeaformis]